MKRVEKGRIYRHIRRLKNWNKLENSAPWKRWEKVEFLGYLFVFIRYRKAEKGGSLYTKWWQKVANIPKTNVNAFICKIEGFLYSINAYNRHFQMQFFRILIRDNMGDFITAHFWFRIKCGNVCYKQIDQVHRITLFVCL